jgi:DNA repair protein RadC
LKHYAFDSAAVELAGSPAARQFFAPIFTDRRHELLIVALCDDQLRLLQLISVPGTEAYVHFSLVEIMRQAVCRADCASVVLAHNHPSGDTRPSAHDLAVTRRLTLAAEMLDISVLDHLIFNGGPVFSFREKGHL